MAQAELDDVSDTALWVAVYRARESKRLDALFRDPLAGMLAGERGERIAAKMVGSRYTSWSIVTRTHIIDNYVRDLVFSQGVDTVINLGAGLDTRPYRMQLPASLRWIEVDYANIIQLKNERLEGHTPVCHLQRIAADLALLETRRDLFAQFAEETKNALILTEGVLPYHSVDDVASLAADLHAHPVFRHWIVDYLSPGLMRQMHTRVRKKQMMNAPFKFAPENWFEFFRIQSWRVGQIRYLAEESEKLGRAVPMPWIFKIMRPLLPRKTRNAYQKFSGYAVLEPT